MLLTAITTFGASPWLPKQAARRSPCSALVGWPVLGPPRCTLTTTSGISHITASPSASCLREKPGAEVMVTAHLPAYEAPMAKAQAAISSSAWCTTPPTFSNTSLRECEAEVAGGMGDMAQLSLPHASTPSGTPGC